MPSIVNLNCPRLTLMWQGLGNCSKSRPRPGLFAINGKISLPLKIKNNLRFISFKVSLVHSYQNVT